MNVTIFGGGNIGTLMAAEIAHKGYSVTIYTSKPQEFQKQIKVFDQLDNLLLEGSLTCITADAGLAVKNADIIWITMPAQTFSGLAKKLFPYVECGQRIGIVPGSGGAEFAFRDLIDKGCILFGLQRVHSIARLKEYGKSVYMLGRKNGLKAGVIPNGKGEEIAGWIERFFDMPCTMLPNYLSVTLTPSNPILHTARLYSLFRNYSEGTAYERNILFYEEWDNESSEMLIACDGELQSLCNSIPLDLSGVDSLCDYYESHTVEEMTSKIRGIGAFKGLTAPMKQIGDRWMPDFNSRYFKADFPYGLKIIRDMCKKFEVDHENIEKVWHWYQHSVAEDVNEGFSLDWNRREILALYNI